MSPSLLPGPFHVCALILLMCSLGACGEQEALLAYQKGQQALAQYDFETAHAHFDEALTLDTNYARAYLGRGQVRWQQRRFADALPDLNRAIDLDPYLDWAYFLRGSSLASVQRFGESLSDFDRFLATADLSKKDRVQGHRWRGIALLNLDRPEQALPDFSACIDLQPDEPFHLKERAELYEGLGQFSAAVADYDAFLARLDAETDAETIQQRVDSLRALM